MRAAPGQHGGNYLAGLAGAGGSRQAAAAAASPTCGLPAERDREIALCSATRACCCVSMAEQQGWQAARVCLRALRARGGQLLAAITTDVRDMRVSGAPGPLRPLNNPAVLGRSSFSPCRSKGPNGPTQFASRILEFGAEARRPPLSPKQTVAPVGQLPLLSREVHTPLRCPAIRRASMRRRRRA